ncbi:hypothetical protein Dsin_005678 [Dipteronia sinensis]|uniref:RNase H type-1 domain-containing protein n=1 Tax=Dipteronia sinensis TaxID=43782 RepID=A0AAE0EEX4_9ROSI|nr:hypothetical protein Dsin_005678 [Dipteronia sinensis]
MAVARSEAVPVNIKWQPSRNGFYKVNNDAALRVGEQRVSLGLVMRDYHGEVKTASLLPVIVETDALSMVDLVNDSGSTSTDTDLVIQDVRDRMGNAKIELILFAQRHVNMVADKLSKMALDLEEDCFQMETFPPCVGKVVMEDLPLS